MTTSHRIETIEDLIAVVTEENLPVLIEDLSQFLALHVKLRDHPEYGFNPVEMGRIFEWNDDGRPGVNEIRITVKDS